MEEIRHTLTHTLVILTVIPLGCLYYQNNPPVSPAQRTSLYLCRLTADVCSFNYLTCTTLLNIRVTFINSQLHQRSNSLSRPVWLAGSRGPPVSWRWIERLPRPVLCPIRFRQRSDPTVAEDGSEVMNPDLNESISDWLLMSRPTSLNESSIFP